MTNYSSNIYSGFQSSPEVLRAIAAVAGEDYTPPDSGSQYDTEDYDRTSAFYRVWAAPTDAEMAQVEGLAWSYARDDDELFWGQATLRRG